MKSIPKTTLLRLLLGSTLLLMGMRFVNAQDSRYHALSFDAEIREDDPLPEGVSMIKITEGEDGEGALTDIFFIIPPEEEEQPDEAEDITITFFLTIPPEGLLGGNPSSLAGEIIADPEQLGEDFDFRKVAWPEFSSVNWKLVSPPDPGHLYEAKIEVTLPAEDSEDDQAYQTSVDFKGDGAIETLDWSSHQRAQAEEEAEAAAATGGQSQGISDMFPEGPDGIGKVQDADNPNPLNLQLLKVEFDNVWDRNLDSLSAGNFSDYDKCIAIEWDSAGEEDLDNYLEIKPPSLTFDDIDDVVSLEIETEIFGNGSIDGSVLDYANTDPGDTDIYAFAVRLLCGENVVDHLIVVIYASNTEDEYSGTGGWIANNPINPAWLAELPAVHSSLGAGNSDPEPGAPDQWEDVDPINNNYHYAATFEIRSIETAGGHGHQACYVDGDLVEDDGNGDQTEERLASSGTADFEHPSDFVFPPTHFSEDVQPFIRAAQLDGNPVDGAFNLNHPLIRLGSNLQSYYDRRPPHTGNQVP